MKFPDLIAVSSACALAIVAVHTVTFTIGRRIGRYNVVDVAWGIGFIAAAVVAAVLGDGDTHRRWLLAVLVAVWGLRLSWHMYRKSAGKSEDPRYADLLGADPSAGRVLRKVFLLHGLLTWFISLPLQLSAVTGPAPRSLLVVAVAGVCLWAVGLVFEAVGDHQLRVFKADPAHRGMVIDRGLWAWTRHPNYFGDACIWWGLWLTTITGWWSVPTVLAPLLMTYFLVYATGARLAEKYMAGRPGFAEYQARTPFFIPRPPRFAGR
jgi:steroid 5-alpha reductase family enzyme